MKRSILFVLGAWGIGGVERVTVVLANEFIRRGWDVAVAYFKLDDDTLLIDLEKSVERCYLCANWLSRKNRITLSEVIRRRNVNVIINQWCMPYAVTRFLRRAMNNSRPMLIAVHHNDPVSNMHIRRAGNWATRLLWKIVTAVNLRLVYNASEMYVVLSPSFEAPLSKLIWKRKAEKLVSLPNPLTMRLHNNKSGDKENILLYVGRLEECQKCVSRIFEIWRMFAPDHKDWKLVVVGDGPDRHMYEYICEDIERVVFVGFANPYYWYEKSKMLLLTSDFEGFPLVLLEAMSAGCVPIVLNSFSSAGDIVTNEYGKVMPMPFKSVDFVGAIRELAEDNVRLARMAQNDRRRAREFSPEIVANRYEEMFVRCERRLYHESF